MKDMYTPKTPYINSVLYDELPQKITASKKKVGAYPTHKIKSVVAENIKNKLVDSSKSMEKQ